MGFAHQRASKVKVTLDSEAFVAVLARYFRSWKELRDPKTHFYFHDENWCKIGDVKRNIWLCEAQGQQRKIAERFLPMLENFL